MMNVTPRVWIALTIALLSGGCATEGGHTDPVRKAERAGVEFLMREVPAWHADNGCFSCHNNGDGARALYSASRKGYRIPSGVLADTTAWVVRPGGWENNKGDPGFSDKRLASIQFAGSLLAASESGHVKDRRPLEAAARKLVAEQAGNGTWPIGFAEALGSPATYGTPLATYRALDILRRAEAAGTSQAMALAENWLRQLRADNVMTAATLLLFADSERSEPAGDPAAQNLLAMIGRGQGTDGGWGPYADSPPEAFDTALVLIALAGRPTAPGVGAMIRRGRTYLAAQQSPDGSWPATTRPSGGNSYAQRISTTGWVTLALMATRP
jgi:hypothetical protein